MASNQPNPANDPFDMDSLLTLEDTLYTAAYSLGASDGARAGRIEGRIFGLEKGFEKFAELGRLHGRSVVWGTRVLAPQPTPATKATTAAREKQRESVAQGGVDMPKLPQNTRLVNNVTLLHSLTDPLTFSTDNTEEAVADFDDRVKRAGAKAKVIERILGETTQSPGASPARSQTRNVKVSETNKGEDSIEDFAASRLLR